ncbi:MAG: hypothetical protein L6R45_13700 [Anaerolineae bacterium]|nr:hypothetical protein [Anaerolineae bacterium]
MTRSWAARVQSIAQSSISTAGEGRPRLRLAEHPLLIHEFVHPAQREGRFVSVVGIFIIGGVLKFVNTPLST